MTNKYPKIVVRLDAERKPIGVSINGRDLPSTKEVFVRTLYESNRTTVHEVNFVVLTDQLVEITEE